MWDEFETALADRLGRLRRDEFLVLSWREHPELFVQFLADRDGLIAECAGPAEAGGPANLDSGQQSRLVQLGWGAPDKRLGFPNYRTDWAANRPPVNTAGGATTDDFRAVASLTTRTFRDVLGVPSPAQIEAEAGK